MQPFSVLVSARVGKYFYICVKGPEIPGVPMQEATSFRRRPHGSTHLRSKHAGDCTYVLCIAPILSTTAPSLQTASPRAQPDVSYLPGCPLSCSVPQAHAAALAAVQAAFSPRTPQTGAAAPPLVHAHEHASSHLSSSYMSSYHTAPDSYAASSLVDPMQLTSPPSLALNSVGFSSGAALPSRPPRSLVSPNLRHICTAARKAGLQCIGR